MVVTQVKALACELPRARGLPLARFSLAEVTAEVCRSQMVDAVSRSTIWRWLTEDAIRPWRQQCWIFPRDPDFAAKAGPILDLYQGVWEGRPLGPDEFVVSTDEKTSIQARARVHPTLPPAPGRPLRVEHEYQRRGAWAYLAALDVHRAKVFGRCEATTGIVPFGRLVEQVMAEPPYRDARRVFWIADNGSSHRGAAAIDRLQRAYPNLVLVHTPVHASWLNQVEIYCSIIQRKVLTPNDFPDLDAVRAALLAFQDHYAQRAKPFNWRFTRADLARLLTKLDRSTVAQLEAAA